MLHRPFGGAGNGRFREGLRQRCSNDARRVGPAFACEVDRAASSNDGLVRGGAIHDRRRKRLLPALLRLIRGAADKQALGRARMLAKPAYRPYDGAGPRVLRGISMSLPH